MSTKPGDWWEKSWNPWEGCTPVSEACENCWALAMLKRFRGKTELSDPFRDRGYDILGRHKPTRYFVGSLTDVFHEDMDHAERVYIYQIIQSAPQHTYCFLTKRPHEALAFFEDYAYEDDLFSSSVFSKCWFGVTTENQARFDERISYLKEIPAAVRFISAEPLLGPIDLGPAVKWLDWVIVGGETGPKARPMHPGWVRNLRDQCQEHGIPFWFKRWGKWVPMFRHIKATDLRFPLQVGFSLSTKDHVDRLVDGHEWNELPKGENVERNY